MENKEILNLKHKLDNFLKNISYKYGSHESDEYVIFLDSKYKKELEPFDKYQIIDSSEPIILEKTPYETWLYLNGDKLHICWVHNKGVDNIDIFKKIV